jgi:hypothetical protein
LASDKVLVFHAFQCTGFPACWSRYGLVSLDNSFIAVLYLGLQDSKIEVSGLKILLF